MTALTDRKAPNGIVLHSAAGYDWLVWFATFGREPLSRETSRPGAPCLWRVCPRCGVRDRTLAISASRVVGAAGRVYGIDASPEMIVRAERKATKAGAEVVFQKSLAQALPFRDAQFDAVLDGDAAPPAAKVREQAAAADAESAKPGGRVLVVDFGGNTAKKSLLDHFHRRHGYVALSDILALLGEAGSKIIESGAVGVRDLHFVLAAVPCCA